MQVLICLPYRLHTQVLACLTSQRLAQRRYGRQRARHSPDPLAPSATPGALPTDAACQALLTAGLLQAAAEQRTAGPLSGDPAARLAARATSSALQ